MTPIEAVTVCVGYGDFLAAVAPHNRPLLDRWVVVTTPADHETREACRSYSIECVTTDEHTRDGAFSKGRMIDRGYSMLDGSGWLLHLDADIALPADLHQVLDDAHLDPACIHGGDRLNVVGYDQWRRAAERGLWSRPNVWSVDPSRGPVGSRVANVGHGYTPIGYFQLWHGSAANWRSFCGRRYPYRHGTAARTDVQHALQWDRRDRVLIPELLVWHLDSGPSGPSGMGANWAGRTTPRFGPVPAGRPPGRTYTGA